MEPAAGRQRKLAAPILAKERVEVSAAVSHCFLTHPRMNIYDSRALLDLAVEIIRYSDAEHPADATLREALRAQRGLSRPAGAEVARSVFDYFRWRGWLDGGDVSPAQVTEASRLAERFAARPDVFTDEDLINKAVPGWVVEQIQPTAEWCRALQTPADLWLRSKSGGEAALREQLPDAESGPFPCALRYAGEADLFRHPQFQAGEFEIQDIASQAVGLVCAPQPGETWWDACAGEGGKLLHLSDLMRNRGLIWASDRATWRLAKLRRRAARAKCFNYRAAAWDGSERLPTKTLFDGVLVDAPCAGLGTWGRNPHARWTTGPGDVAELADVQLRLLRACARAVKVGGRLVYAVCTLSRAETDEVAESFTTSQSGFEPLPFANPFAPQTGTSPRQTWWPQTTGGNGMFVAVWLRKG